MSSKTTRFERTLETVSDASVGMDQDGVIRFVNRQSQLLFGYDRDQLIGRPIQTLLPEPFWQVYASHQEYFSDPRSRSMGVDLELRGRHHDGTEFPINVSLSHIDTGDVLLVITAVHDVPKQKRAVRNAELTAAVVEYSDDAIIGTTLEGVVTSWNPAAERMYGYSSTEIIGRSGTFLTPDDRVAEFFANLARVKDGQHVEHFETMRVRKDGSVVPVSITVAPIRDEDGVVVGASKIARDLTEQEAWASAQRTAAIIEYSDAAIFGRTLDGVISSWNPAAERMFGFSSAEIVGKSVDLMIPVGRQKEAQVAMARVSAGHAVVNLETVRNRKDGTVIRVSLTVAPIRDVDGAIVGACVIGCDMTDET